MRRRDMPLLILAATASAESPSVSTPARDRHKSLQHTSAAEAAAHVIPTDFNFPEADPRRYGASISAVDNSAAINSALLVSAYGGSAAFIPPGTWNITSTLRCTSACSMYGAGQHSVIVPQKCDGLTLGPQSTYNATRFFRDFQIIGIATSRHAGIMANIPAATGGRITGVQFSNLTIQNFGIGVFARGIWNCSFRDCFLYNNFYGYHFHGQSIANNIDGGFVQQGSIVGSSTSYGVLVDSTDGESCQSLNMNAAGIYGYDVNISLTLALYTTIDNCNVSAARSISIQIITVQGGTSIRGCWIQTNGSATTGVQIADRGTAAQDKIVIEGCTLECDVVNANSVGIYVGGNQLSVTTNNNTIGTSTNAFATGINNRGAHNHVAKFNTIYAIANAVVIHSSATNLEIGPNIVQNGVPLTFSGHTAPNFSYYASGAFALELTGMTARVRDTIDWTANGRSIHLFVVSEGLLGSSNSNEMSGVGLPKYLAPASRRSVLTHLVDNGVRMHGEASIDPEGSIFFAKDANVPAFTASGKKGLSAATSVIYDL